MTGWDVLRLLPVILLAGPLVAAALVMVVVRWHERKW